MLSKRSSEKEQMDNFELSGEALTKTLNGLSRINKYLGNTSATLRAVKKELLKNSNTLKIVDLGCGGGDNLRAIAIWCQKHNRTVELVGIDGNKNSLKYANQLNNSNLNINYLHADIIDPEFLLPSCDILISSHFIYHFSDDEMVIFMQKNEKNISSKIIFSELHRTFFAYYLFKIGAVFFPFSNIVKQDGLTAIKRSFTRQDLTTNINRAGFSEYTIKWKWAFRFLAVIVVKK